MTLTSAPFDCAALCSSYRIETPDTLQCGGSNSNNWSQTTSCKYIRSNFNGCIQRAGPVTCGALLIMLLYTPRFLCTLPDALE